MSLAHYTANKSTITNEQQTKKQTNEVYLTSVKPTFQALMEPRLEINRTHGTVVGIIVVRLIYDYDCDYDYGCDSFLLPAECKRGDKA